MYFDLDDSRLSQDFSRPFTEDALAHFDPDLVLAWNREAKRFQVLRRCIKTKEAWCPSLGKVTARVPALVHVCDWEDAFERGDDPGTLIARLVESDTRRYGKYLLHRQEKLAAQAEKAERDRKEDFRHAFLDNKRLLVKGWEPFVNFQRTD